MSLLHIEMDEPFNEKYLLEMQTVLGHLKGIRKDPRYLVDSECEMNKRIDIMRKAGFEADMRRDFYYNELGAFMGNSSPDIDKLSQEGFRIIEGPSSPNTRTGEPLPNLVGYYCQNIWELLAPIEEKYSIDKSETK